MSTITILKKTENDSGWQFTIRLSDAQSETEHLVTVTRMTYEKLTGGQHSSDELIIKSFEFLLEREPKESILREFELDDISTYFPGWGQEMVKAFASAR